MAYARGHVRHPAKDHLIAISHARHGHRLHALRAAASLPSSFDARTMGFIGPIKDQGSCGSCWDFSGTGLVEVAYNKAGIGGGAAAMVLSEEYTLSCLNNGGCDGDDNVTVLEWAKGHGLPLTSDYGPYKAAPGTCLYAPTMKLYSIDDWGFANATAPDSGVAPRDDIKSAIMQYGAVGCAVAADDKFEAYTGGVFADSGSTDVNHDVMLVGWDDADGAWILRNSWTAGWGESGYMRIAYGANQVGIEAVWAVKNAAPAQ